jgi:hypothetical protein
VKKQFLSAFIALAIFYAAPAFAKAAEDRKTDLTYDVYAGGIHALDAHLSIKKNKQKYDITLSAATQGLLKRLANWSGKFSSNGLFLKRLPSPLLHKSSSTWKEKTETKNFHYNSAGKFLSYKVDEDGRDKTPKDIDKNLAKGTTDVLSATFRLMLSLPKNTACNGNALVYDGDRTYRLIFADTKKETLKKSSYNIYDGESVSCTVEVKPEKGKWRKKPRGWLSIQEQGRQKGALPTVWFGQMAGQKDYYVPVKIRVKTDYGTLFMHLTSAKTQ